MMQKRPKQPSQKGGSRALSYIIVIALAVLIGYYVVLPAFTPRSTTTATTTPASTGKISLTPSSNIAATMVTLGGHGLPDGQAVTAVTFGSASVQFNSSSGGSCTTSATGALSGCAFWVPPGTASGTYVVSVTFGTAVTAVARFKVPGYSPPVSTILVTLTFVALGLSTQLVTRRVVDLNKERRMRAELNAFNKEKREATLAKDQAKLEKLKKRELAMRQEQAKVSTARLKVTGITFVPLLAVYYLMATFLGGYNVIVAYSPIPIPIIAAPTLTAGVWEVSFFWWYFLSSFAFSSLLSRLLHTNP